MRWIPFVILVYLVVLVQCTMGRLLTFSTDAIGTVGPDLAAVVAVFFALHVRVRFNAVLAGWVLGLAVDLTTISAAGGVTAVGPMPIAYAIAAALVFQIREAFFYERMGPRVFLTLVFCVMAHGVWVTLQTILAFGDISWADYGRMLLQAAALSVYSAVLMLLVHPGLIRIRKWFISVPTGRRHRRSAAPTRWQ